jgi:hypothetical protein
MILFAVMDATHYPVAVYRNHDTAVAECDRLNTIAISAGATGSLCYVIRTTLKD